MSAAERVEDLLAHYLRTVWQAAGLKWDSDHYAEVGAIVDGIANMIRYRVEHHEDTRHADPGPTPSTVDTAPARRGARHDVHTARLADRYGATSAQATRPAPGPRTDLHDLRVLCRTVLALAERHLDKHPSPTVGGCWTCGELRAGLAQMLPTDAERAGS